MLATATNPPTVGCPHPGQPFRQPGGGGVIVAVEDGGEGGGGVLGLAENRKSRLQAPTMLYTGHEGEVFSVEFSPDGNNMASGSFDRSILVYHVYGDCENWCALKGHTNAVLELHWSPDGSRIFSCSADNTLAIWDVEAGTRIKKLNGHTAVVNSCHTARRGPSLLVSGGDDGTTKIWDARARRCVKTFEHQYQILSVTFDDSAERVFSGSLDNTIRIYNMVTGTEEGVLMGHTDSITGLDVSKDGSFLLSNGMDQTIRLWDISPFPATANRLMNVLAGATHNFEKNLLRVRWSRDDAYCASGSADRYVYVWDMSTKKVLYRLPGHAGSVNEVCFHPSEPVIASCSSDKQVYMGELS
eukprot:GHVQ01026371.1.p1 GENE.GHVQ01026371.1~~GHVQ01026371.1.p1  ORF type:complete len:357 (-),score=38.09 GHVQ01026371.1:266-1336(-)